MLVGRAQERHALDAFVSRLRGASGGGRDRAAPGVMICGEPGIGKTALLDDVLHDTAGLIVLRASGTAADDHVPFGALTTILAPVADRVAELPRVRATALGEALAHRPTAGGVADPNRRRDVHAATSLLLTQLSQEAPVLLAVDDLPDLDQASRDCLLHVLRDAPPAALGLMTTVLAESCAELSRDLDCVRVGPLGPSDARDVLRQVAPGLPGSVETAFLEASSGNPRAVTELPLMLHPDQLAGLDDLPEHLPLGPRLRAGYARRLGALRPEARDVLLLAALGGAAAADRLGQVLDHLGAHHDVLDDALDLRLVELRDGRVHFTHDLARLAVIDHAGPGHVRRAHQQLGEVLPFPVSAWHRADAVLGPHEPVARALEAAGDDALARRSPAAAADAYVRAATLSEEGPSGAARLVSAGAAAFAGGDARRALRLLDEAAGSADGALRHRTAHLAGVIDAWSLNTRSGHARLVRAADAARTDDPAAAALLLADAALAAGTWDCALALEHARGAHLLATSARASAGVHAVVGIALATCLFRRGDARAGRPLLAATEPLVEAIDPESPSAVTAPLGLNLRILDDDYAGALLLAEAAADSHDGDALASRALPLIISADACRRLGRHAGQLERIEEGLTIARDTGQRGTEVLGEVARCQLLATIGDEAGCRHAGGRAVEVALTVGMESAKIFAGGAFGLLALGAGRLPDAVHHLEGVARVADDLGYRDPLYVPWLPDLVETYVRLDRRADAEAAVGVLTDLCADVDAAGATALLHRCRGLLSGADDDFAAAIELHDRSAMPFATARTRLLWGEQLRRRRQKAGAREQLGLALEVFTDLGATPWVRRARHELEASDPVVHSSGITPQQWRIALAVTRGARNKEIAAEIFLSEKTVERHLAKLFRIAGVRSRTELAHWVREQPP